jgi:hypothetical protein
LANLRFLGENDKQALREPLRWGLKTRFFAPPDPPFLNTVRKQHFAAEAIFPPPRRPDSEFYLSEITVPGAASRAGFLLTNKFALWNLCVFTSPNAQPHDRQ